MTSEERVSDVLSLLEMNTSGNWQQQVDLICQQIRESANDNMEFRDVIEKTSLGKLTTTSLHSGDTELSLTMTFSLDPGKDFVAENSENEVSAECATDEEPVYTSHAVTDNVILVVYGSEDAEMKSPVTIHPVTDQVATQTPLVPLEEMKSEDSQVNTEAKPQIKKEANTSEKKHKCDVCEKSFSTTVQLTAHKHVHKDGVSFECGVCHASFTKYADLSNHQKIHTCIKKVNTCKGRKRYVCEVCSKVFTRSNHLADHKLTHTGSKPFKCDTCDKAFTQSIHLKNHLRIHTGERPFKCDICSRAYKQVAHLNKHYCRPYKATKAKPPRKPRKSKPKPQVKATPETNEDKKDISVIKSETPV